MSDKAKTNGTAGKRRPQPAELSVVIEMIAERNISLRAACDELGLHPGHTSVALQGDNDLWAQYMRAREMRGEAFAEDVVTISKGVLAGRFKPDAARVAMEGLKWAAGRMNKGLADSLKLEHTGKDGEALPAAPAPITFLAVYPVQKKPA